MFNGILNCAVREKPRGPNEIHSFMSGKGQNIQRWILLVPMPADVDPAEYIPQFLCCFQCLCNKTFIRSAYKSGAEVFTTHHGLLTQISDDGAYWHVIDNASQKDTITKSNNCLSEVILGSVIKDVVCAMFGVTKDPNTWTDS